MVELENPVEEEANEKLMKKKNEEIMKKQQEFEILESEKMEEALRKNSQNRFDFLKWGVVFLVLVLVVGFGIIFL